MSEKGIITHYKKLHDKLTQDYYKKHLLAKEDFDLQHAKIWNDMEAELIRKGYTQPPKPVRDLEAEIDALSDRITALEPTARPLDYQTDP